MPKICLFDASGYLFRAYHALPPLTTSKGQPVGAIYGYMRMISKILKAEKPDYVGVCFDTPEPTFRHEVYEDYKATRDEPDDDIIQQIPVAEELTQKWGLPTLKMPGYEADDLIATYAKKASDEGWTVLILSGDKDILQLVNDKIVVRDDMRKTDYNEEKVVERYGIRPDQLVDLQSLMGDKIDNVIGIPGVGVKTAAKLLAERETLEGIYEDMNGTKPALKEKLVAYKKQVFENRHLVRLKQDVPIKTKLKDLKVSTPDENYLKKILSELEFRGEFEGVSAGPVETEAKTNTNRKIHTILSSAELKKATKSIKSNKVLAYDLETTSPDQQSCDMVGVSLSVKENEAYYIPVGHQYMGMPKQLTWDEVKKEIKPILEDESLVKCGQNLKFDNTVLERYDISPKGRQFDTMLAAYCLEPERNSFGLKSLSKIFLNEKMTSFEEVVGKKKDPNIAEVPIDKVADYAGADSEVALRLMKKFEPRLKKEKVVDLFEKFEMPLVPVLQAMEAEGVSIDADYLKKMGSEFHKTMASLEKEIHEMAGEPFKLNSPKQLSRILFEKLKLPVVKKTKTGYSTNEEVLTKLSKKHPICEKILSYRELAKLTSTYVESLLDQINPKTKRVHTSFHQTGTSTGRLSSSDPNLQNIPIRTEHGREIRKAFVASKEHVLVSADYSQIDLRSLAHMSADPVLIKTFNSSGDVHTITASEVFHVKTDKVTTDMRRKAKAINFGIVYGQQAWGLSQGIGVSKDEAQEFIDRYFERYAGVKKWIESTLKDVRKTGWVTTLAGRRRKITDINSDNSMARGFAERIAINTPIQGSSADIIKAAMIRLYDEIREKGLKAKMLIQVHDDLLFEVPKKEFEKVIPMIREGMEKAFDLKVPLLVDMKSGANWKEMEPLKV